MTIDAYQLPEEQYTKFFEKNARLACQLYLKLHNIATIEGVGNIDFRTLMELYNDCIYASNEDCRQYQKQHDPEVVAKQQEDLFIYGSPSREEMMEEIKSINAKVESIVDYITGLTDTLKTGFTKIQS
jgi:hypothetical protein